ncbi:MAG: LptF/LptG family permease [Candidatus Krumholzibacteria bacterium]|nr:LptF/LptG family permease [Candidatus Krumholzibacteria bacterium]
MLILERYILRNYIGPFIFSVSVITFVFIMDFIIRYIDLFLEKGVKFHIVLQAFLLSLGHMFALIIPMAVLPATLMSYGNLASENEITAMKTTGVSLYRMILPGAVAGTVLAIALVYYNSHVLPETNHALLNLLIDINRKQPTVELKANQRIDDFKGYTIYFREKNDRTGEIKDVQIVKHAAKGVYPTTINAESGTLKFLVAENVLRFDLANGEIHELPVRKDLSTYRRTKFKNYTINIKDVDRTLQRSDRKHRGDREMSVQMMREKIEDIYADIGLADAKILRSANSRMNATFDHLDPEYRERLYGGVEGDSSAAGKTETKSIPTTLRTVQERGRQTAPTKSRSEFITRQEIETQINTKNSYLRQVNRYRVEIHKKFSIPFACIIFVLVGSPIAIRTGKSGMNTAIGLSILFFLVYYICLIGGEKLADRGFVNPIVAMWSPNAVFFVMAFLLLRAAARERSITEWRFAALLKPFRRNAVANSR